MSVGKHVTDFVLNAVVSGSYLPCHLLIDLHIKKNSVLDLSVYLPHRKDLSPMDVCAT